MMNRMNRRDFLLSTGATAAAATFTIGAAADDQPATKRKLKKAVMYATIGFKAPVLEQFKALKDAGFEGVEPMSHMNRDEVLKALEETGLKAASVCCNTHWAKPLSHPDEKVRRVGREGLQRALQDAKHYGASSVLLVPGVVNKEVSYDDCFSRSVAEIRQVVPVAKDLGVKIAIENVWNSFITKPDQAIAFLDAIDSPEHVGWHFDIGNVIKYGNPEDWIPVLGKRILKLHIKEYSKSKGFGVQFFEGDNHWPAIMKALDAIGYDGWGISEQPGDQTKDPQTMKEFAKRMDRVFAS